MYTEVNGTKLHYECFGSGNPVLVLHGWGADIAAVRPIANCVAALGMQAVCLDFPGFGKSPAPQEPWHVADYAVTTREFMRQQRLEGCDVVCHSFGGRVVIVLAAGEPGLFNRLVLVDAAGVRPRRGLKYYLKTWAYKLGKRLAKIAWLNRLFGIAERQARAGSEDYRALSGIMRKTMVNVVNQDLKPLLGKIQNPALLVWGENDTATPMYMAKEMERRIKGSGLAVMPGVGHYSYAEDYPRFCAILKAFLGGQEGA